MQTYKKDQLVYFFKISLLALIISFFVSISVHGIIEYRIASSDVFFTGIKIFFDILPIAFIKQKNFLFKDGPIKATILILYYLLLVPMVDFSLALDQSNTKIQYIFNFLSFFNILLLIISHIILLKYVIVDFFRRRRKVVARDIGIVITTYITIAISFGLIYTLLSLLWPTPVFSGITHNMSSFHFYMKHIYFSFITISTVGYGDIYPLVPISQFLAIVEIVLGIILTNVILGLVIGSGILTTGHKEN